MSQPNAEGLPTSLALPKSDGTKGNLPGDRRGRFLWLRRIGRGMQVLWCAFGIALAVCLSVEIVLERVQSRPAMPPMSVLAPFLDAPSEEFLTQFGQELQATSFETTGLIWEPFSYWRNRPFAGQFVHIDEKGLRRTWNPPSAPDSTSPRRPRIFFLGGSAMWGYVTRDERTIPSLVTRELSQRGVDVESTNFGQNGYVSTQEVILLLRELQRGNVPDVVVFLDGFNDICSAEVNEAPGESLLETERRLEFRADRQPAMKLFERAVRNMAIGRLFSQRSTPLPRSAKKWRSKEEMVDATIRAYLVNVDFVEAVKKPFGFETLYCWQPVLYVKPSLSEHERAALQGYDKMQETCKLTWSAVRRLCEQQRNRSNAPRLCYLADLFNQPQWSDKTAFLDRCHLTESGNETVAREIASEVELILFTRARKR